jgi:hypothetical protein
MFAKLLSRSGLALMGVVLAFGLSGCSCGSSEVCTYSPLDGGACNNPDEGGTNYYCYQGDTLITQVCASDTVQLAPLTVCKEYCEEQGLGNCDSIDSTEINCDCVKCNPADPPPTGIIEYQCDWNPSTPPTYHVKTGLGTNGEQLWSQGEVIAPYTICILKEFQPMATEMCVSDFVDTVALSGGYVGAGEDPPQYPNKMPNGSMIQATELGPCLPDGTLYTPVTSAVVADVVLTWDRSSMSAQAAGQMVYGIQGSAGQGSTLHVKELQLSAPGPFMVQGEELVNVEIKLLAPVSGPFDRRSSSAMIPQGSVELLLEADATAADGSENRYIARVFSPDNVMLVVDGVGNVSMNALFRFSATETVNVILSGLPQGQ